MSLSRSSSQQLAQQALAKSANPADATVSDLFLLTVLIDNSGSMNTPDKIDGVITGQNAMLDAFKDSSRIVQAGLRISQWTFNVRPNIVNGFVPLNAPQLTRLDRGNYHPDGGTALYDTVIAALSAARGYADTCKQNGFATRSLLAVLSDGEDTTSQAEVGEAKQAIEEELQQGGTVIYTGIGGGPHRQIGISMGFREKDILLVGATAKEIRAVFELLSSRSIQIINE